MTLNRSEMVAPGQVFHVKGINCVSSKERVKLCFFHYLVTMVLSAIVNVLLVLDYML